MEDALNCSIAPAISADADAISSMSARLIEAGLPQSWTVWRVGKFIRSKNSMVLTARVEGVLVGFAIMHFKDDEAHLNLLAVEPGYRRAGIGRSLLCWLEESAVVAGIFLISLEVRADNSEALKFYADLGYQETGLIPRYYDDRFDAALLARDLRVVSTAGDSNFP
jgi:ribosomal-protein-alanine N-acetyltransferase